ncbi:MAG: sugar transferase [Candidatus Tectomicrobia bacterium]|uniref:Sugar transferase n=1 Tax=Tectimicrobiota bacterium TaxID=2528274 RepID=A0A932CPY9_UNCTE|nr:sugar transferase [Candidatus Tectomicrobia bacterium]
MSLSTFPYNKGLFVLVETLFLFSFSVMAELLGSCLYERYGLPPLVPFIVQSLAVAAICQLCLYYFGLYDLNQTSDFQGLSVQLLLALGTASIVLALIGCFYPSSLLESRIFLFNLLFLLTLFPAWRGLYNWVLRTRKLAERVLVLGSGEMAKEIGREIMRQKDCGYQLVGFLDPDPARVGMSLVNPGVIGTTEQLLQVVSERGIHHVVVALGDRRGKLPLKLLMDCKFHGVRVEEGLSFYERLTGKIAVDRLWPSWLIFSDGFIRSRPALLLKAVVDSFISLVFLVLWLPVMLLVALLIKLDSRGPVFYKQERVGKEGKTFMMYKFRSMRQDAEAQGSPEWAQENDPRVTRVGRFIRKTRIDEIPQVLSVL